MTIEFGKSRISHERKVFYQDLCNLGIVSGELPEIIVVVGKTKVVRYGLYFRDKNGGGRYMSSGSDYLLVLMVKNLKS